MKIKFLFLLISFCSIISYGQEINWHTNLEEAITFSKKEHKKIILIFSGSDWCKPCIQLKSEVLESPDFIKNTATEYIFVHIDFKRNRKKVSKERIKYIEAIAEKYNPKGAFPYLVIFDENLKILRTINGYKGEKSSVFIETYFN